MRELMIGMRNAEECKQREEVLEYAYMMNMLAFEERIEESDVFRFVVLRRNE